VVKLGALDQSCHQFDGYLRHQPQSKTLANKILSCFNWLEYFDYAAEADHVPF